MVEQATLAKGKSSTGVRTAPSVTVEAHKASVFIADDEAIVRAGLIELVTSINGFTVCGSAGTVRDAFENIVRLAPDVVFIESTLERRPALELIGDIRRFNPDTRIIVLSRVNDSGMIERSLRAGAAGYIVKSDPPESLHEAIHKVISGEVYLGPSVTKQLLNKKISPEESQDFTSPLSNRELQVFHLIGEGLSSREIAKALSISTKTVDAHKEHIKDKLNLQNASDLARSAALWVSKLDKPS